jgi:hypothetical protein
MNSLDAKINSALRRFWPEDAKGNRKVWFHWQNLNEDRNGRPKGLPYEGRCWLHSPLGEFNFEWALSTHSLAGIHVQANGESGGLSFHTKLIPVSLFLTLPVPSKRWKKRYGYSHANFLDLSLSREDDVSLRWQFGGDTMSWSSKTPKWKNGSFSLTDFILGKRKYTEGDQEVHRVKIPMPEGAYDATVALGVDRWERPRWFPLVIRRTRVDVPLGIPFPGKGENSWDCGEDASFGFTGPAENVADAIGKMVASVLDKRRRHGRLMMEYPTPAERAAAKAARPPSPPDDIQTEANMKPGRA